MDVKLIFPRSVKSLHSGLLNLGYSYSRIVCGREQTSWIPRLRERLMGKLNQIYQLIFWFYLIFSMHSRDLLNIHMSINPLDYLLVNNKNLVQQGHYDKKWAHLKPSFLTVLPTLFYLLKSFKVKIKCFSLLGSFWNLFLGTHITLSFYYDSYFFLSCVSS